MTRQRIVAIFDNATDAGKASRDFDALSEKDEGFRIERGVMVQKEPAGKLTVLDTEVRTFCGALSGALIGMLGGPAATAGLAAGAGTGVAATALLDSAFVESVSAQLPPGSVACILEAKELTPFSVDNFVKGFGGKVLRRALG
ncbi:DUF1269 domain-containing protein [Burkholderia alba]|uniref:DUF1269 domain-containing protein n=1 Tax=Burkholderia alba TaxID=2683677 RepID=UPI002B053559|nr:DUF1269 domain-containing protein [Burkholderia alba]